MENSTPKDVKDPGLGRYFRAILHLNKGLFSKGKRLNLPLGKTSIGQPENKSYPLAAPITTNMDLRFGANAPTYRYQDFNSCIYRADNKCEKNASIFSDEHVVAAALGSYVLLPHASCPEHSRITSGIESIVVHKMFDTTRKNLTIKGRDRKELRKSNFVCTNIVNGSEIKLKLPIDLHPTVLVMLRLAPPGLLVGRPKSVHGVAGYWAFNLNADVDDLKSRGLNNFVAGEIDTLKFPQMLAKIAHSFASAHVPLDEIDPLLPEFISSELDDDDRKYDLIGGDENNLEPTPYLHELGLATHETPEGECFLVARIRLMAFLGAPAYFAVVGRVPDEHKAGVKKRLLAEHALDLKKGAFVDLDISTSTILVDSTQRKLFFKFQIQNNGQSTAFVEKVILKHVTGGAAPARNSFEGAETHELHLKELLPKQSFQIASETPQPMSLDNWATYFANGYSVLGLIAYRDEHGRKFETGFGVEIEYREVEKTKFQVRLRFIADADGSKHFVTMSTK